MKKTKHVKVELKLAKETIKALTPEQLADVNGGVPAYTKRCLPHTC